jgi:glycine/D-amino acid oxidase-like deaminating enzyme
MTDRPTDKPLPSQARVVIIGGGVIGCSIAYHLTKLGWRDVLLLERKQLTCGTTWHAAGLLTTLRDTVTQTRLAKYTQDLYRRLEAETGQATGVISCGSIQLAATPAKAQEMRRGVNIARSFGVEGYEIDPDSVQSMWPLADVSDLTAAFHFPGDARANPADVTQALAKGARAGGATLFEHTRVTGITSAAGRVTGVITERGTIHAEFVVNCAGMWAREVGRLAGVDVPLQAAEHYYLISEPVEGMHPLLPILRDPCNGAYIREEAGKIMVGLFEPIAKAWGADGIPEDFCFGDIPPDWDRMYPYIEQAMRRVPTLANTGIKLLFCGPESFTPDHNYLMGEAPNLRNFFIAAGFNSLGILSGGGVGQVMSQWIVEGHAPMDVWSVDIRRLHAWQNNSRYLLDRTVESLPAMAERPQCPQEHPARPTRGRGRLFWRIGRLGATQLVRTLRAGGALRVQLGTTELVREQRGGAPCRSRTRRPVRAELVCEAAAGGARCRERSQSHRHRIGQRVAGSSGLYAVSERARRHRGGSDHRATGSGSLHGHHRRVYADACRGLDPQPHTARSPLRTDRYVRRLRHAQRSGTCLAGAAAERIVRGFLEHRLSLRQLPRNPDWLPGSIGIAADLRGRAGLGTVHPDLLRPARLRRADCSG